MPLLENKKVCRIPLGKYRGFTKFPFHVFDRYESHTQAVGDDFMEHLSFLDHHLHKTIFEICT